MNDVKKERFTSYLPIKLIEQLRQISDYTGIPQTRLLEKAVEEYLKKIEENKELFKKL